MKKLLFLLLALPLWANADLWVSTVQPSVTGMPPAPDGSQTVQFIVRNTGNAIAFNFTIGVYSNRSQSCTSGLILEDQFLVPSLSPGHLAPPARPLQAWLFLKFNLSHKV